jgi:hypothetical protein
MPGITHIELKKEDAFTAYKGFDFDLTCRGFQYKVGESYHEDDVKLCEKGFHCCGVPNHVERFYTPYGNKIWRRTPQKNVVFAEVKIWGHIEYDIIKCAASDMQIVRILDEKEWSKLCNQITTEDMLIILINDDSGFIPWINEDILTKSFWLAAVKKNGIFLEHVPEEFRDREMCLAAVMEYGGALEFVPDNIKDKLIK